MASRIVGLLPVRNEAKRLPRWLERAPAWCDAVVALDDGSTDETREILEASPLVEVLLTSPPRPSAEGWHDGRNRRRLLDAGASLAPDWIVQIDADEELGASDAPLLRRFLSTDAIPGLVYGLLLLRAWGEDLVDPTPRWVYRIFDWRPGLRLPDEPLHFHPVPMDVPRNAWVRTTLRLRHFGSADERAIADRIERYRQADPEGRYPTDFGGLDAPPRITVPWRERPPGLPVLASTAELEALADGAAQGARPLLAVLLPARNGEEDLPGWFENVRSFADTVVALDDGSTDRTLELLEADPLVSVTLTHPRRETAAGWDDARNRQELLDAAAQVAPRWVLFLDVDERLDPDDAAALRASLEKGELDPEAAYGFLVHRMTGPEAFDRASLWVFRLFAWRPGLLLPTERMHLVPVPVTIPQSRWRQTTVRIRHLAGTTVAKRRGRYEKYAEADPEGDYEGLLAPPGRSQPWERRPPGLPVVEGIESQPDGSLDLEAPVLSAIVIAREDEDRIERVVRSVTSQVTSQPFETIVVVSGSPATAKIVSDRFPQVKLVELDRPALPGEARNAGLMLARGDYVSFPGSHVELPQGSLEARIRAHQLGYPMVTGSTLNGNRTRAGWAAYLLDHSSTLPGRPSQELDSPPVHCSYDREILLRIGAFPEDVRAGEDTSVNIRLAALGFKAYRAADVTLVHASRIQTRGDLARHHFERGRALARILIEATPPGRAVLRPAVLWRHGLAYVPRRIWTVRREVRLWGGERLTELHRRVAPLIWLGAAAAWAGCWTELLRRSGSRGRATSR